MVMHMPLGSSMKYLTHVLLYTVCSPLVLADNPVLGDLVDIPNLSPDAQFCELGKPKGGKYTDIEKCKKGDLLFFGDLVKAKNAGHFMRICEFGSFSQSQIYQSLTLDQFAICIYRGSEMPIRQ